MSGAELRLSPGGMGHTILNDLQHGTNDHCTPIVHQGPYPTCLLALDHFGLIAIDMGRGFKYDTATDRFTNFYKITMDGYRTLIDLRLGCEVEYRDHPNQSREVAS